MENRAFLSESPKRKTVNRNCSGTTDKNQSPLANQHFLSLCFLKSRSPDALNTPPKSLHLKFSNVCLGKDSMCKMIRGRHSSGMSVCEFVC